MPSARIDSIGVLRDFKVALAKFAEAASAALSDAESEMMRMQNWVDHEQNTYWQGQIRKRTELLGRAKEALRMKKLFKDSSGRTPSAVDEEKAVQRAKAALEQAEQKLIYVKKWSQRLQKEAQNYKGSVQRFATSVQVDVPVAMARLEALAKTLDAYVALGAPAIDLLPVGESAAAAAGDQPGAMARAVDDVQFPRLSAPEVAVCLLDAPYNSPSEKYAVFASLDEARVFIEQKLDEKPDARLVVYDHEGSVVPLRMES